MAAGIEEWKRVQAAIRAGYPEDEAKKLICLLEYHHKMLEISVRTIEDLKQQLEKAEKEQKQRREDQNIAFRTIEATMRLGVNEFLAKQGKSTIDPTAHCWNELLEIYAPRKNLVQECSSDPPAHREPAA